MKKSLIAFVLLISAFAVSCKKDAVEKAVAPTGINTIKHAKGLEIYRHDGYSIVKVTAPWPDAKESFTYVLHKQGAALPDSLKNYTAVQVPIKTIAVTSTTHIPSLEALGAEKTLVAFPNTKYVSSLKTRALIDSGKVKEIGTNESINIEMMIDIAPDAMVAHSISSDNKTFNDLMQSGIKVLYNGDWTEQTPLGKAEWIKFFGALYDKNDEAEAIFNKIEQDYDEAKKLAQNAPKRPTVLCGAMYQDHWYLPQGNSWAGYFLNDAHSQYLWADSKGTGSLNLSFETVFEKAKDADFWIGPSEYTTFAEMEKGNPHYAEFKAFKNKNVYSWSSKKGPTGGLIYYELAPNRPDLVLKDLVKIFHPELLPNHTLQFFDKLK
ncbi:ABC transporter substrate-binding protein [Flavobacterium sp. J372]|uniref:ABC transporter substrate-binding protein n=1 Tax=Flavobacterium sp. J372 TaxID=2898436 RepID=UPI0021506EC9|nr:ABC transporter substrate-binding protein [Flavobacterium sp. J372]MCR5861760.1 ABC transporter substrate-binding protein [Flavobacterium sp. J372]